MLVDPLLFPVHKVHECSCMRIMCHSGHIAEREVIYFSNFEGKYENLIISHHDNVLTAYVGLLSSIEHAISVIGVYY